MQYSYHNSHFIFQDTSSRLSIDGLVGPKIIVFNLSCPFKEAGIKYEIWMNTRYWVLPYPVLDHSGWWNGYKYIVSGAKLLLLFYIWLVFWYTIFWIYWKLAEIFLIISKVTFILQSQMKWTVKLEISIKTFWVYFSRRTTTIIEWWK